MLNCNTTYRLLEGQPIHYYKRHYFSIRFNIQFELCINLISKITEIAYII